MCACVRVCLYMFVFLCECVLVFVHVSVVCVFVLFVCFVFFFVCMWMDVCLQDVIYSLHRIVILAIFKKNLRVNESDDDLVRYPVA